MKWKCNTFVCGHKFEDVTTEEQVERDDFVTPICPKCKDEHIGCYRIGE